MPILFHIAGLLSIGTIGTFQPINAEQPFGLTDCLSILIICQRSIFTINVWQVNNESCVSVAPKNDLVQRAIDYLSLFAYNKAVIGKNRLAKEYSYEFIQMTALPDADPKLSPTVVKLLKGLSRSKARKHASLSMSKLKM